MWIHDPDFYLASVNNDVLPSIYLTLEDQSENPQHVWLYVRAVYHSLLDRPGHRCQQDPLYSFTACIRNSLARRVGCRLPWDPWAVSTLHPACTRVDQVLQYEQLFYKMAEEWEQQVSLHIRLSCLKMNHLHITVHRKPIFSARLVINAHTLSTGGCSRA